MPLPKVFKGPEHFEEVYWPPAGDPKRGDGAKKI
jgi:hypothetical protein